MSEVYIATASAEGQAFTKDLVLVTASASASAESTISQEDALNEAIKLAIKIAKQVAENDANIIDQSLDLALDQGYFLPTVEDLPNNIINPSLNLSFRDIGIQLDEFLIYLITTLYPTPLYQAILDNTTEDQQLVDTFISVLRRLFSNYANNPANIKDKNGKYIGDKYGLRIMYMSNDGFVNIAIQTFCKDVAVKPYIGTRNNYMVYYTNPEPIQNIVYNASKIDLSKTDKIPYNLNTLNCHSTQLPKSEDQTELIYDVFGPAPEYKVVPEVPPEITEFSSLQIFDNHGTRYEVQQSRASKYGYAARRSDTTSNFNWYVATNLAGFNNPGTSYTVRLSYFEWSKEP